MIYTILWELLRFYDDLVFPVRREHSSSHKTRIEKGNVC
ncbi:hypothetical protein LEP1GSC125_0742 [Leptospira mayottensis 200901122]|uniref:Uncharacterized protein n=1 Tax=Leptospira mayottensis 200901122 TaxID=1193010 RepID=A0AA87MTW7_9LEPT|nr:hypothetical protein LEP1GSC125_0742 [Leptospira mayottensis 200901122]